jgi:hypothetical protein
MILAALHEEMIVVALLSRAVPPLPHHPAKRFQSIKTLPNEPERSVGPSLAISPPAEDLSKQLPQFAASFLTPTFYIVWACAASHRYSLHRFHARIAKTQTPSGFRITPGYSDLHPPAPSIQSIKLCQSPVSALFSTATLLHFG